MIDHSITLLVCCTVIVILAALLYAAGRSYLAMLTSLGELRATLSQVQAGAHNMDQSLRQQRRALYMMPTSESLP